MSTIKIDISKKLQPLLKSVRKVGQVVRRESAKAVAAIKDIESGKLKIVATVTITKKKP